MPKSEDIDSPVAYERRPAKRKRFYVVISSIVISFVLLACLYYYMNRMKVTWKPGSEPMVVTGKVVNESGQGLWYRRVDLKTDSGPYSGFSRRDGSFRVELGEAFIRSISIGGYGNQSTGFLGLDASSGLEMTIILKE